MKWFLGIHGTTSQTTLTIIDQDKHVHFESTSGPTALNTADFKTIKRQIQIALKSFLDDHLDCFFDTVYVGLDELNFINEVIEIEQTLRSLECFNEQTSIHIHHSIENILHAGQCFEEGIALVASSRMMAFGKDLFRTHRTGGWGYKEGELGSSYAIGLAAIRYAVRCFDGRYDIDSFAEDVAKAIGLHQKTDIFHVMDDFYDKHTKIASLAPIVTMYANRQNAFATRIIDQATDELALAVHGVYRHLSLKRKTLVVSGGLGQSSGVFKTQLETKIHDIDPDFIIIQPLIEPSLAAALMAMRLSKTT